MPHRFEDRFESDSHGNPCYEIYEIDGKTIYKPKVKKGYDLQIKADALVPMLMQCTRENYLGRISDNEVMKSFISDMMECVNGRLDIRREHILEQAFRQNRIRNLRGTLACRPQMRFRTSRQVRFRDF